MAATTSLTSLDYLDSTAALCTFTVNGKDLGPHAKIVSVHMAWGEHPSKALALVPLKVLDDTAPSIAGVSASPVYGIKHGDTAVVSAQISPQVGPNDPQTVLMTGTVTAIDPEMGPHKDEAIITIEDARFEISGRSVIGSFWSDLSNAISYRHSEKAHFNKNNSPNAIYNTAAGCFLFCTPWYGINDTKNESGSNESEGAVVNTTVIPTPEEKSTTKACYWTPRMMLAYLKYTFNANTLAAVQSSFPELLAFPSSCIWPLGLESAFDESTIPNERKAAERIYHCHDLMAVVCDICKMAGAYAPYVYPYSTSLNAAASSMLSIVKTRYNGVDNSNSPSGSSGKGVTLQRAISGPAETVLRQGGNVSIAKMRESSKNLVSIVSAVGAKCFLEKRFDSHLTDPYGNTLYWGWTQDEQTAAKAELLAQLNNVTPALSFTNALIETFKRYPRVFACWMVNPTTDFQLGTGQEGFPLCKIGRPPLPHQLSSFIQSGSADQFALINSRRPIPIEFSAVANDTAWFQMDENHGLEIDGDGTISLRAIRDQSASIGATSLGKTYTITTSGSRPNITITAFGPKRIRMNIAIANDRRLSKSIALTTINTDVPKMTIGEASETTDDNDRIVPTFKRVLAIDTGTLHAYEERGGTIKSYPIPASLKTRNNVAYPAADGSEGASTEIFGSATVLRDDSVLCRNHALRRLEHDGRLDRGGTMTSPHIILTDNVGDFVDALQNVGGDKFPIKAAEQAIELSFEKPQKTERTLV